jgi:hypothetical protein
VTDHAEIVQAPQVTAAIPLARTNLADVLEAAGTGHAATAGTEHAATAVTPHEH